MADLANRVGGGMPQQCSLSVDPHRVSGLGVADRTTGATTGQPPEKETFLRIRAGIFL